MCEAAIPSDRSASVPPRPPGALGAHQQGVALEPVERLRAEKGSREKPPPARDLRWLVRTDAPIAKNAGFLAGKTNSTGRSGAPLECFAEAERHGRLNRANCVTRFGAHARFWIWLSVTQPPVRLVKAVATGKHAERRGVFMVNEAFAALRVLVRENNLPRAAFKSGP